MIQKDSKLYQQIRARGMMTWPTSTPEEEKEYAELEKELKTSGKSVTVEHPFFPKLKIEIYPEFGGKIASLLKMGDYELLDLELFETYLVRDERVLEIGGGVGMTAAFCALCTRSQVHVVEANPTLTKYIRRQFEINGLAHLLSIEETCVSNSQPDSSVPLYIHAELWLSTLLPKPDRTYKRVMVPTKSIQSILAKHPFEVLAVDIEGGEVDLFKAKLPACVKKIFVEIHSPDIGEAAFCQVITMIQEQKFQLKDFRNWVFYFERK